MEKSEIEGKVSPPPSKSYTHRALIAASFSERSRIKNPLLSEDTLATINGCRTLGADIWRSNREWEIRGVDEIRSEGYFYFANSGTTLRFFIALLSLSKSGRFSVLDGDSSLRARPNRELALALIDLGAKIYGDKDYRAPLKVKGIAKGGEIQINAPSSQFVSALLFSLPLARVPSCLKIGEIKSRPYIDITLDVLEKSGIEIIADGNNYFIQGEQNYSLRKFHVPADFSSASYLIAAALLAGELKLVNLFESRQGDRRIVDICREMGGDIKWKKDEGIIKVRKSSLKGVDIDASDIPDLVPTIAVLAAVAEGETRIYNAEHLRIKEIDRIDGIVRNLRALGVDAEPKKDGVVIKGGKKEFSGIVNSYGDHRMALAFSLLGLLGKVKCVNAEVVSVSYPQYFDVLKLLGAEISII